jgi:5-hydroxyisourate hydrolase-like protein (transthyretin family)
MFLKIWETFRNKILILPSLSIIHLGDRYMKKRLQRKSISYAVIFILLGTCLLPFNSMASTANIPINNISQNLVQNTADDTEYWALLVAVGVYAENPEQNRPDMLLEVDDLHTTLLQSSWWSEDHIKVIKGEDATCANIIAGLRWLDKHENSNDISLVFLSTHGFPLGVDIPPADEADGTDEALVSYWGFAFPNLFIWDDELNVLLNRLESKGVCLIVDSCYAGGFNDPPNWNITNIPPQDAAKQMTAAQWVKGFGEDVRGQKRVVLMGSCEDELSYSGGFAPYIIDGLRGYADTNGDGVVTAEETFYYAQPRSVPRQNPTMYDGYDGDLPLVSVDTTLHSQSTEKTQQSDDITEPAAVLAETSTLCGYIQDATTANPIENALVSVRGRINENEYYENQTTTNTTGYYQMNTPAIRIRVTAGADGYLDRTSGQIQMYENQTRWVNLSLYERPPETAIVCGYVTDQETTQPLAMANVSLQWQISQQQYYENDTTTDITGYYQMSVAAGDINLQVNKDGYFSEYTDDIPITDNQTLWINISLNPHPLENGIVCGYVTDTNTGDPLSNVRIDFEWINYDLHQQYDKEAQTNATGFYSINISPGELYVSIRKSGYDYYDPYRHDAFKNSTVWFNCSLTPSTIEVDIAKPLNALYIQNKRIIPLAKTRIIGPIDIAAYIPGGWGESGFAERVEFYIDGELRATVTTQPYNWTWENRTIGHHVIKIVAYGFSGDIASKEIEVNKFL